MNVVTEDPVWKPKTKMKTQNLWIAFSTTKKKCSEWRDPALRPSSSNLIWLGESLSKRWRMKRKKWVGKSWRLKILYTKKFIIFLAMLQCKARVPLAPKTSPQENLNGLKSGGVESICVPLRATHPHHVGFLDSISRVEVSFSFVCVCVCVFSQH